MDLEGLVVNKGLKGKQNKKKWNKNIDVSGLLERIQQQQKQQLLEKSVKPLIVEDTTNKTRNDLDPNRFKNRIKSQPKQIYDNSYKRSNLIEDGMEDAWDGKPPAKTLNKQQQIVPAIIKPPSGHSYNPKKEHIQQIIDEVIDFEKQRPRKQKMIKKAKQNQVIKRVRNKKLRQQFLEARRRKKERQNLAQIYSMKKLNRQLEQKQKKTAQKIEEKRKQEQKRKAESRQGKVREGPKIGKTRYKYRQYIPSEQEIGKKISKVAQSDQLMKQRYDSIFRRGVMEPRAVKVHANKTKNIKVTQRFEQ